MINLTKGNTNTIIVTPKENTTTNYTFFKIVFTNRVTQDEVDFWFTNISTTDRYQKCTIVVNTYFLNFDEGFWTYEIFGCAVSGGVPTSSILESGYMYLRPATNYNPTEYNEQSNNFKTYNG